MAFAVLGLHAVMRPDDELASTGPISLAVMSQRPYITLARQLPIGALTARSFEKAGFAYRPSVEVMQFTAACGFVEAGFGVAILDGLSVVLARKLGLIAQPLELEPGLAFRLIWPRGNALSKHAELLRTALRAAMKEA